MTAAHTFKVGDKVRREHWADPTEYVTVTAIGLGSFLGVHRYYDMQAEHEADWSLDNAYVAGAWVPYIPPPVRTRWTVETERRVPIPGETLVVDGVVHRIIPNSLDTVWLRDGTAHDVIVAVTRQDGDQ